MKPNGRPFTRRDAVAMFDEMVLWLAEHQVAGGHPHEGAVYFPTEDRFCNRDTACMARAFMRQHARTGDPAWRGKAASAREYVLSVQKPHGGFPELRGRAQSDDGSTVNTASSPPTWSRRMNWVWTAVRAIWRRWRAWPTSN